MDNLDKDALWEEIREAINQADYPDLDFLHHWKLEDYYQADLRKMILTMIGKYHTQILKNVEETIREQNPELHHSE